MRGIRNACVRPGQLGRRIGAVLAFSCVLVGCSNRHAGGDLVPPSNAPVWDAQYADAFDNGLTPARVVLEGRAPNDVLDQSLFQRRLGHASLVVVVRVEQVWGRGRNQGRQDQFLDVALGKVLLGKLPRDTDGRQMLLVDGPDDLPGSLGGKSMLLFVRWAPGLDPPFFHHLIPADDDVVALIEAMVQHAKKEGVLARGEERGRKRGNRRKRRREDEG